jgi:hypothetical protein
VEAQVGVGHEGWRCPFPGLHAVVGFDVSVDLGRAGQ